MAAPTFDPTLYRLVHRGNPGDVRFYLDQCRGAGTVLELGCGDGRLLRPLMAAGLAVVGLDRHAGMLAAARAAARGSEPTLVCADMRALPFDRRFDRIVIPYNVLYCLADDDAVVACLRSVSCLLGAGGRLLFDVYTVEDDLAAGADAEADFLVTVEDDGTVYDVYEHTAHDRAARRFAMTYVHVPRDAPAEAREYTLVHHYLDADSLPELLLAAGLAPDELWGGFDRRPYTEGAERIVVRAGRSRR